MEFDIEGNAALVTASSAGLGLASAKALAREGANVVINGRDGEQLADAAEEVRAFGTGEVATQQGDLTVEADIDAMVETTVEEFGGMDHLVTSAGGPPPGSFLDTDDEDWYDAYELLVMSVVRLARKSSDHLMAGDGGTVVTITSRSVKEGIDSLVLSNSVRMSVVGLEKTLSKEWAPDVRANTVMPGSHETKRIRNLVESAVERGEYDSYADGLAAWGESNPLGRVGDPMELGNTVAFLSAPQSGFINGAAIPIDGGDSASNL